MSVSSNLGRVLLTESQAQKATVSNLSMNALEESITEKAIFTPTSTPDTGDNVTFPHDDTNDLSPREGLRFCFLEIAEGNAIGDWRLLLPPNKRLFIVINTSLLHEVTLAPTSTPTPANEAVVPVNSILMIYANGTGFELVDLATGNAATLPYDFEVQSFGAITDGQVVGRYLLGRNCTFPEDFAGSVGLVLVNPTSAATMDIEVNAVKVGEIQISTGGVVTFTSVASGATNMSIGDEVTIVNQVTADATMSGLTATLVGSIT